MLHIHQQQKATFFVSITLLCLIITSSIRLNAQLTEKNYKIFDVRANKEVTLQDIADDMETHDVLFFGEEHNDSVTHFLEFKMLEILYQTYNDKVSLSMEMFERDVQPIMNEYLTGTIREKNFIKDARAWKNYRDYKPMVEFAKKNQLDVICANAAGRYTNLVGRKGQEALMMLPYESSKNFAPVPFDTASGAYYDKLTALTSHEVVNTKDTSTNKVAMPPSMEGFNMILSQSLWDATMAFSIAHYLKENRKSKVLQINGRFHSDEGFAVVTQLKKYRPKTSMLIISSTTDDSFPNIDWSQYKDQGDYIIITDPSVPRSYAD